MLDKKRSREIRCEIRRILMSEWDPIGVSDTPEATDEYDSYIGGVYDLLERRAIEADICAHLRNIEVDRMQLVDATGQPLLPEVKRNAAVASLVDLRNSVWRQLPGLGEFRSGHTDTSERAREILRAAAKRRT